MSAWLIVPLAFVLALVPALIARHRGLGFWTFYLFGLLLWVVAVPVALLLRPASAMGGRPMSSPRRATPGRS